MSASPLVFDGESYSHFWWVICQRILGDWWFLWKQGECISCFHQLLKSTPFVFSSLLLPYLLCKLPFSFSLWWCLPVKHTGFYLIFWSNSGLQIAMIFIDSHSMEIPVWMYKPKREFGEKEGKGTRPEFWVPFLCKEENKGKETTKPMEGPREYVLLTPHMEMSYLDHRDLNYFPFISEG